MHGMPSVDFEKFLGKSSDPDLIIYDSEHKLKVNDTRQNLLKEANRLSILIAETNSNYVTGTCGKLLAEVRKTIYAMNDKTDIAALVTGLDTIKYRLINAEESREAQKYWSAILVTVNFLWLGIIGFFIGWKVLIPGQENLQEVYYVLLACALWGAVGGVVDALFAIQERFSKQEFDVQNIPWYFLHPLIGLSLGGIVFLLMQAGLLATTGTAMKETTSATANDGVSMAGTVLPIAIAFLAGFKQNSALGFISRIVKSVFDNSQGANSESDENKT